MPEVDFDEDAWRERLETFRQEKETYLLENPESPLADVEPGVEEIRWFPLDPAYRVVARYQPVPSPESVTLPTTTGPDQTYERVATFGFTLDDEHHVLTGYRAEGEESPFVPFTDETNGNETPTLGRYLLADTADAAAGDEIVLEFNAAQLPYAAYSDQYSSTVPPAENHVSTPVRAGERRPSFRSSGG